MKKLSSGTEKEVLKAASRLAEILSLEDFKDQSLIDLGKKMIHVTDDPSLITRFSNGREQKLEIIRDVIVDLSAGAPWLQKGCFGLISQNNAIKKVYLLNDTQLKGYFLYKVELLAPYKEINYQFTQEEVNAANYYMVYLWSVFTRTLAKRAG